MLLLAMVVAAGCDEPVRTERPLADHGPEPDRAADPIFATVHAWGREAVPRMSPEGPPMRGELRAGQVQGHLVVLLGTHCYTFLATGDDGVEELELRLIDPAGVVALYDSDSGPRASLGLREQLCPDAPGAFELRVRVTRGSGSYVAKMYAYQVF